MAPNRLKKLSTKQQAATSPPLSLPPRKHSAGAIKVQILVDVELSGMWDASSVVIAVLGVT